MIVSSPERSRLGVQHFGVGVEGVGFEIEGLKT